MYTASSLTDVSRQRTVQVKVPGIPTGPPSCGKLGSLPHRRAAGPVLPLAFGSNPNISIIMVPAASLRVRSAGQEIPEAVYVPLLEHKYGVGIVLHAPPTNVGEMLNRTARPFAAVSLTERFIA